MSKYYNTSKIQELVKANRHRHVVGGLWGEIGELQFAALKSLGMDSHHSVLDAGCGSLRLGRKLVRYLEPGQYYGTDLNEALIDAGYDRELDAYLKGRLPRENLKQHDVTQPMPFDRSFDYLVAFSLFTHLTAAQSQAALQSIATCMHPDSCLMATVFVAPDTPEAPYTHASGITTHIDRDPFHVAPDTVDEMARAAGLSATVMPEIAHPRGQSLYQMRPL